MENTHNSGDGAFGEFIAEISLLKEDRHSPNALEIEKIDPASLTREDMDIWRVFKDKTMTKKKFDVYRAGVEEGSASDFFAQYVAEQIGSWNYWPQEESDK